MDLAGLHWRFRNAVPGLDDGGSLCHLGGGDLGRTLEEPADRDCVRGVIRALVNDLQLILRADDGSCDLDAARTPTAGSGISLLPNGT